VSAISAYGISIFFEGIYSNTIDNILGVIFILLSFILALISTITTLPILYMSDRKKLDDILETVRTYKSEINNSIAEIKNSNYTYDLEEKMDALDDLIKKKSELSEIQHQGEFDNIIVRKRNRINENIDSLVREERNQTLETYYKYDKNAKFEDEVNAVKYIKKIEDNFDFDDARKYDLKSIFGEDRSFDSVIQDMVDECYDYIESNEFDDASQKREQIEELVSLIDQPEKPEKVEEIEENIVRSEVEYYRDIAEQSLSAENYSECEKYINQAEQSVETSDIPEQNKEELTNDLDELRDKVTEQEIRSEIHSYQSKIIDLLGEDIGDDLFEPDDQIRNKYKKISEIAEIFDRISYDRLDTESWDRFKQAQTRHVSEITVDEVENSKKVIQHTEKILSYLETVDSSHPSIDEESWEDSMETALEEQYTDILTPIISQIDRLEDSLWEKHHLHQMTWEEFEELIGSLYDSLSYTTTVTQDTADLGVDVWAENDEERVAIQVKQFSEGNTVGRETLQKLASTIAKGDADRAIVITSSSFARTAKQYSNDFGKNMELVDGDDLIQMLSQSEIPPPV
jgi:HJR/Mrr/RecB family endonuclease